MQFSLFEKRNVLEDLRRFVNRRGPQDMADQFNKELEHTDHAPRWVWDQTSHIDDNDQEYRFYLDHGYFLEKLVQTAAGKLRCNTVMRMPEYEWSIYIENRADVTVDCIRDVSFLIKNRAASKGWLQLTDFKFSPIIKPKSESNPWSICDFTVQSVDIGHWTFEYG